jgi:hypothetical protein
LSYAVVYNKSKAALACNMTSKGLIERSNKSMIYFMVVYNIT